MDQKKCKFFCYKNTRQKNKLLTGETKKTELIVFDMDGVLTDTMSSWVHVHQYFNTCNDKSVDEYLKGKIDDMEFIRRDVSLWKINDKPIPRNLIVKILSNVPIMKGAYELFNFLQKHNIKTAIVSAGLDILADRVSEELGIDYIYANGIDIDNKGYLTEKGLLKVQLMYKDNNIKALTKKLKIPYENVIAVGNSCFDIPMFELCSLGIAFNPEDDCTRKASDYIIEEKDLSKVIPIIKKHI